MLEKGILLSVVIMANINTPKVDNKMLDNLLSNDELNVSIIRESKTPITNTLETVIQKTKFLDNKNWELWKQKYDELRLPFKKTTYIAGSWEIIKCDIDNAPKNDVTYL